MKALSIRQPYSYLIVNGIKDIENRTWKTNHRGTVLIHAGLNLHQNTDYVIEYCKQNNIPLPDYVDCGGVVGIAEIVDVVTESKSPWFVGPYGFVLANARPLPFFECKGRVGIFEIHYNPTEITKAC